MEDSERVGVMFERVLDGVLAFGKRLIGHVTAVVRQVTELDLRNAGLVMGKEQTKLVSWNHSRETCWSQSVLVHLNIQGPIFEKQIDFLATL